MSKHHKAHSASSLPSSDDVIAHSPVVLDIAGLSLHDDDRRRLEHPLTGGLILFARNWATRAQLTALIISTQRASEFDSI